MPDADQGRLPLRLRRHGRAHAADADVHARATTSSRRRCTPAACATTATRRASARWSRRAWSSRWRSARRAPSRPRSPSRAPRGSSRRPSPRTRSAPPFDEAEAAKEAGEERVILVNVCGHGHFDMSAYDAYLRGELADLEFCDADMEAALERLPDAPVPALAKGRSHECGGQPRDREGDLRGVRQGRCAGDPRPAHRRRRLGGGGLIRRRAVVRNAQGQGRGRRLLRGDRRRRRRERVQPAELHLQRRRGDGADRLQR